MPNVFINNRKKVDFLPRMFDVGLVTFPQYLLCKEVAEVGNKDFASHSIFSL